MRTPGSIPPLALAAAAAALVAASPIAAQSTPSPGTSAPSALPALAVQASLTPQSVFFGDPVDALVAVSLDTNVVEPGSLRVVTDFLPYEETGSPEVTRSRAGSEETVFFRYALECLDDDCLPTAASRLIQLPSVVVTATAGHSQLRASGPLPALLVSSRLDAAAAAAASPPFRWPASMPPPVYRVDPGALSAVLVALAALLGLGAVTLVGLELTRLLARARARRAPVLSPLQAALEATRQAARRRDAADRRKALGLLALALRDEGHPQLAQTAVGVAWAEPPPTPTQAVALADEVEASLEQEPGTTPPGTEPAAAASRSRREGG
jgi:hypothetical protein